MYVGDLGLSYIVEMVILIGGVCLSLVVVFDFFLIKLLII